jgi:hypothetical protein
LSTSSGSSEDKIAITGILWQLIELKKLYTIVTEYSFHISVIQSWLRQMTLKSTARGYSLILLTREPGMAKFHCKSIVSCSSQDQILKTLFDSVPHIRKSHAPTLESILDENPVPYYHYEVTFETAPNYDIVTVHTSGTSGTSGDPKAIVMSTKAIAKMDQRNDLPIDQGTP